MTLKKKSADVDICAPTGDISMYTLSSKQKYVGINNLFSSVTELRT